MSLALFQRATARELWHLVLPGQRIDKATRDAIGDLEDAGRVRQELRLPDGRKLWCLTAAGRREAAALLPAGTKLSALRPERDGRAAAFSEHALDVAATAGLLARAGFGHLEAFTTEVEHTIPHRRSLFADLVLRDPGADVPVLLVEVDRENEGVGTLVEKLATYRAWCELPAKGHREGRVRNEHAPPRRPHPRPAGTVGGGLRDHWLAIVGPDAAAHWHLAGYDPTTRRLRVVADSPAWAAQLRLHHRRILTDLEQLRPGTVRAIDVRVGPAPVVQHNQDPDDRPARRDTGSAAQPARPPLADHAAYQELRRRMREAAAARQAALDEAAAEREAILRRNYNRLREPEQDHRPSDEDQQARARAAHARELLARHRAALAVARGNAIPLRTARQPRQAPARGAA